MQNPIKWTGSKRPVSQIIVARIPETNTYYEPFLGGGNVLLEMVRANKAKHYIGSDTNEDLIQLWRAIQSDPKELALGYAHNWNYLNGLKNIERKKEYYYSVRAFFNNFRYPSDFLFLLRTSINGLVRYNKDGDFNTSLNFARNGIKPPRLAEILRRTSALVKKVEFVLQDYREIKPTPNDYVYLDPPYPTANSIYAGRFDHEEFFSFLKTLPCGYTFSYGSNRSTLTPPADTYSYGVALPSKRSGFSELKKQRVKVREYLYVKYGNTRTAV